MDKRQLIVQAPLVCIPFSAYDSEVSGGSFDCTPREMQININIKHTWTYIHSILLHETFECVSALLGGRFSCSSYPEATDSYVFHFDHNLFSKICYEVSAFMTLVVPEVYAYYERKKKDA